MRVFGLIGNPLTHSFSVGYFAKKFLNEGVTDAQYNNYPLETINQLSVLLDSTPLLRGLNVTIPYKEAVIPFLNAQNDVVRDIGACNCIDIRNGQLFGYNTDVTGFRESFLPKLPTGKHNALVLGTGGASKAVVYVLQQLSIPVRVVTRVRKDESQLTYADLSEASLASYSVVVNTTPLGMYPNLDSRPAIPYQAITKDHYCYDLVYNPSETSFLKACRERGAITCNGADMLAIQAEESWRIWNS